MVVGPNHHFLLPASADASQAPELAALPNLTFLPDGLRPVDVLGRCIQHEMDHLNGVLFVDRVTDEDGLQKELKEKGFERQDVRSVA